MGRPRLPQALQFCAAARHSRQHFHHLVVTARLDDSGSRA
jgi:hypothetical protein